VKAIVKKRLMAFFISYFSEMDITINTPALFFPAISLIMLAYTNRFLALADRVRNLHAKYQQGNNENLITGQIRNLRYRLRLIKQMQAYGVVSFLSCIVSMFCIYINSINWANVTFGIGMLAFVVSLVISFIEIQVSTKALEIQLGDMEHIKDPSIVGFFKNKFDKE
jgi:hypothetical protein